MLIRFSTASAKRPRASQANRPAADSSKRQNLQAEPYCVAIQAARLHRLINYVNIGFSLPTTQTADPSVKEASL